MRQGVREQSARSWRRSERPPRGTRGPLGGPCGDQVRLDLLDDGVLVTLSRRNLLALLAKLDEPGSARTVASGNAYWRERAIDGVVLAVRAEADAEHYREGPPPGQMTIETEAAIVGPKPVQALAKAMEAARMRSERQVDARAQI